MSTIKSSDEHLTINADGSGKDIKFQANGVEKASISSSGAFTSTTIDATKLTGDFPAISGANLTGISTPITALNNATANELVTVGSTTTELDAEAKLLFDNAQLVIGNGSAEDTSIKYHGNSQNAYLGLDDSTDEIVLGWGSTVGSNKILEIETDNNTRFTGGCFTAATHIVMSGKQHYGPFTIQVSGLTAINGNSHKRYGLRLMWTGITGGASDASCRECLIAMQGLTTWNNIEILNQTGTTAATITASSSTGMTINVTSPNAYNEGAFGVVLFANSGASVATSG